MSDYPFPARFIKKTKVSHQCDWCSETIILLEPHVSCRGVFDGNFSSMKFHPECFKAAQTLPQEDLEIMTCYFKRGTTEEI